MAVSAATYERVALEDWDGLWELVCGELRRKPPMTTEHGYLIVDLDYSLKGQLDANEFLVRTDPTRLRAPSGSFFIPDLCVMPRTARSLALIERRRKLEVYDEPMPLVVEVWSPSTGRKDTQVKLREYRSRNDLEIWFIHPRRRSLTAWCRQPDGSYIETRYTGGSVQSTSLTAVSIQLELLFGSL